MMAKLTGRLLLGMVSLSVVNLRGILIEAAEPPLVEVFVRRVDDHNTYRIPSLICTPKGTLLAFCEGRKFSAGDQSPTNIVLKRSLDGGKTWLPMQVIVQAVPESAANPTAVIDRVTDTVLLVYDRWPELPEGRSPVGFTRAPGLGRDSVTTWITTSDDEGVTWSTPVDITATTKKPEWTENNHGPGVGIQTRAGRLIIPCNECRYDVHPDEIANVWNFAIYSDDHGKTWRMSDHEVGPGLSESQMVELADGSLLLNARSYRGKGCRAGAISNDGGKTWSEPFDIPELPEPVCQASILRYTRADEQGGKNRILFCNPACPDPALKYLHGGTVRISYDEGKSWPVAKIIYTGYFRYSCLTAMPDGTIGCLFETAGCNKIGFLRFSLAWLTDGKDTLY